MDRAPGKLAMADLAPPWSAHSSGLADRERRGIVMQEKSLLLRSLQRVDPLLLLAGAERRHHQGLALAAREQGRAVRPRQNADFRNDGTHGLDIAAIDAPTGVEDVPAYDLGLDLLEDARDLLFEIRWVLHPLRAEMRQHLGFRRV